MVDDFGNMLDPRIVGFVGFMGSQNLWLSYRDACMAAKEVDEEEQAGKEVAEADHQGNARNDEYPN